MSVVDPKSIAALGVGFGPMPMATLGLINPGVAVEEPVPQPQPQPQAPRRYGYAPSPYGHVSFEQALTALSHKRGIDFPPMAMDFSFEQAEPKRMIKVAGYAMEEKTVSILTVIGVFGLGFGLGLGLGYCVGKKA